MSKLIAKAKTTTTPALYRDFFKDYYKEKTKVLTIFSTVIGIAGVLVGLYGGAMQWNVFLCAVPIAGGAMLIIYPHFSYRRPYKSVKNNKITTRFEFYDDKMVEFGDSSREEYEYSSFLKARETKDYIYLYHTNENASVVDKSNIKGASADELRVLLKKYIPYKIK